MVQQDVSFSGVIKGLILLLLVLVTGTAWFQIVEDFTFLDALYMTVITVSTVGFKEVHELDDSSRVFVLALIIGGLTVLTYTLGAVGRVIIEGSIYRFVGRQKMYREIEKMKDHYIVCGHGRMGQILCQELTNEKVPFLVVEGDAELADELNLMGYLTVVGDATEDETLGKAGVARAKGLVAVVSRDVDNLYITLSAREMCRKDNPDLYILSRATDQQAGQKIARAGANRVVSPYTIGGMRIVQALLRPTVSDFLDIATQSSGLELMFEQLTIGSSSELDGAYIKDSGIRRDFDVIVIGIKRPSGEMVFNPGPDIVLQAGDVLITLGDKEQLERMATSLA